MTLFIANMWHDVFVSQSVINKAMQLVARQRAKGEVLSCLRAFLSWEKVRAALLPAHPCRAPGTPVFAPVPGLRPCIDDALCVRVFQISF